MISGWIPAVQGSMTQAIEGAYSWSAQPTGRGIRLISLTVKGDTRTFYTQFFLRILKLIGF